MVLLTFGDRLLTYVLWQESCLTDAMIRATITATITATTSAITSATTEIVADGRPGYRDNKETRDECETLCLSCHILRLLTLQFQHLIVVEVEIGSILLS